MLNPNTSASGGYLRQTLGPADGIDLRRFIGTALVGISGYPAELVRPAWQLNPAPVPGIDVDWLAFGMTARRADNDPYFIENQDGNLTLQIRHEELDFLLNFYGPNCIGNAASFRDATDLSQNQEAFYLAGMALVDVSDILHTPELFNEQWIDRCDMTITIRREIRREYNILNFVAARGAIYAGVTETGGTMLSREYAA